MNHERLRVVVGGHIGLLRRTLATTGDVDVVAECEDVPALLAAAEAELGQVAVVAGDLTDLDRSAVSALRRRGMGVVGAVVLGDIETSKLLRRLAVDARIFIDSDSAAVSRALVEARTRAGPRSEPDTTRASFGQAIDDDLSGVVWRQASPTSLPLIRGVARRRVIAVWGPAGAPGRSTVAAGLAGALARRGLETLLIDADTYGGAQAISLALPDESPGLVAAIRAADRGALSIALLADLAIEVEHRLRVLTGIQAAYRWTEIRSASFEHVLALARDLAGVTVVDCGFCLEDDPELSYDTYAPRRNAVTLAALDAADDIVVVGRDDGVGLARLEAGLLELRSIGGAVEHIVLNQVRLPAPIEEEDEAGGRVPGLEPAVDIAAQRRRQAWRRLRNDATLHPVLHDECAVIAALRSGLPVTSAAPDSGLGEALRDLARALVPQRRFV